MPVRALDRTFSRRMLPLAALAAVVVAAAPPLSYRAVAWPKARGQAGLYASHLAAAMSRLVARQPYLWRFDADKVLEATAVHRGQPDISSVRITDCQGGTLFAPDAAAGGGLSGWAPILWGGEGVGWVEVQVATAAERRALGAIALASALMGMAVGLLLYRFPTRVVRRQAGVLDQTLTRLRGAEVALTDANRRLAERVEEAVGEARRLSERVVSIQEEERRRIARDLHDSVGQDLTALQLELALVQSRPQEAEAHQGEAARCCEEALREVRRVVHDLAPPELGTASLPEILRAYTERFEVRTGTVASFRLKGGVEPGQEMASCLLRVLQEALTNVARHAKASEVGVTLALLAAEPDLEVVGEAADGARAVALAQELVPDVVVMDLGLPGLSGVEATRRLRKSHPGVQVVVLSMHDDAPTVDAALHAGARGYVLKGAGIQNLREAIRTVQRGEVYLSAGVSEYVLQGYLQAQGVPVDPLTDREREILKLIAEGCTGRQIAEQLGLKAKTVENHRARICEKLDVHTTAGLVRYALRAGIAR